MSRNKRCEAQISVPRPGRMARCDRRIRVVQAYDLARKTKFGDMEASEGQKLRALEDGNGPLKRLVAELNLDREMLKIVNAKRTELAG